MKLNKGKCQVLPHGKKINPDTTIAGSQLDLKKFDRKALGDPRGQEFDKCLILLTSLTIDTNVPLCKGGQRYSGLH